MKTAATPAEKARLTTRIKAMEDVLKRWRTYAPDEYLATQIKNMQERLDEARAERDAMDGKEVPDATQRLR